jgi:YHS domain-containing protein
MKRYSSVISMLLVAVFAVATLAVAAEPAAKGQPQTMCPVLAGKIDKKVYEDYQGKRVYFCCASCKEDFLKDPTGYIKKMEDQGVVLDKTPGAK